MMDLSIEWPLPETKESYTVQFDHAPWVKGGVGQYENLTLQQAKEEIAGMKEKFPEINARYVKAVTTYEFTVEV